MSTSTKTNYPENPYRAEIKRLISKGAPARLIVQANKKASEFEQAYRSPKAMLHFSKPLDEMQLNLVKSILGQLSDGIWGNSPKMNKYWKGVRVTAQGIEYPEYLKGTITGPLYAKLLSRIVAEERKDEPHAKTNKGHVYEYLSRGDHHQPKIAEINELIKILKASHH